MTPNGQIAIPLDKAANREPFLRQFFVFHQVIDSIGAGPPQKPRAKRIHENRLCTGCLIAAPRSSASFFLPGIFQQIMACRLQRPVCMQVVV